MQIRSNRNNNLLNLFRVSASRRAGAMCQLVNRSALWNLAPSLYLLFISGSTLHAASLIKVAQAWDSRGYGNCISVGSDNVGPLLINKCDAYLAVLYTDDNQCRVGCKVYIHAHDSERVTSPKVHHVEACRSPAYPHFQPDGTYICKP
jgi:hypothetical protein